MRDDYIHESVTYSQGGGGYGLALDAYTSDTLVENNIINFFNKPFLFRASGGGNVVAYNYIDGGQDSASGVTPSGYWMEPDIDSHMVYSHMELVEGNLSGAMGLINTWGGAGYITFFRNRVLGQHQDPRLINDQYGSQAAFSLTAGSTNCNIVGNVLGITGLVQASTGPNAGRAACLENLAENDPTNQGPPCITYGGYEGTQGPAMYRLGNGSIAGSYAAFDVNEADYPNIAKVNATTLRHGNYDYVTGSVRWDGTVANHDLPPSLYRVDPPSFFAGATWPWVDPAAPGTGTLPAKTLFDSL
jgi:hypothetical protein